MLDRLRETGEVGLGCFTDEELAAIHADEDVPFRPAAPPARLSGLSAEARQAVLETALRSLIARGSVRPPDERQLEHAPAGGRVELEAAGDLDSVLAIRRSPTTVVFVVQSSYLAVLHGFRSTEGDGFLEERVTPQGLHHFRLLTPARAVEALAGVADPDGRVMGGGPDQEPVGEQVPEQVAAALRELSGGVTRVEAYQTREAGSRRAQLSLLVEPERTWAVTAAFGVAPHPPRAAVVNRAGMRRWLQAVVCDQDDPTGGAARVSAGHRCPVCGYPDLEEPPRSPRTGGGSYEICPSCGFQFGVTDDDRGIGYEEWRRRWIEDGMPWRGAGDEPPEGWDPREQLRALESGPGGLS